MNKVKVLIMSCIIFISNTTHVYSGLLDDTLFVSTTFTPKNGFSSGVEGPAVDSDGNIYAVNYGERGTIGKVTPEGIAIKFLTLANGSIGNGIRFNSKGDMFIADYKNHNILKVNMDSKSIEVYAHDNRMNQPNDIAITDNGVIYASDPNWSESTGNLWMIDTNGTTHLLESGMSTTNGVEVSPDNKTLYVGESDSHRIWAYDILPNDSVSNKRLVKKFFDGAVLDGMRCDSLGNLYVACNNKQRITILSPDGNVVREVATIGSKVTNIAFGGVDGKTCYVTVAGNGNIETFRTDTPGRSWVMRNVETKVKLEQSSNIPTGYRLEQNYPNPFNPSTKLEFSLPKSAHTNLSIFNVQGKKVATLVNKNLNAGTYKYNFDADSGILKLVSGRYFYRLESNGYSKTRKMVLVK